LSLVLVIAGGTASGKTTIARSLAKKTGAALLCQDRYYHDIGQKEGYNFDEPAALDFARMAADIETLKQGRSAQLPVYHFPTHTRLEETEEMEPAEVLIVEGILVLACKEVRALGDVLAFVEAPADTRLARRVRRDALERGRSVESVLRQYMDTVRPMHEQHVAPSASYAHILLDGCMPVEESTARLAAAIQEP
jgi:uridine kinase